MSAKVSKVKEVIVGHQFGFYTVLGLFIVFGIVLYATHGFIIDTYLGPAVTVHLLPAIETAATWPWVGGFFAWMLTWEWDKAFVSIIVFFVGFFGGILAMKKRTEEYVIDPEPEKPPEPTPPTKKTYTSDEVDAKIAKLKAELEQEQAA